MPYDQNTTYPDPAAPTLTTSTQAARTEQATTVYRFPAAAQFDQEIERGGTRVAISIRVEGGTKEECRVQVEGWAERIREDVSNDGERPPTGQEEVAQ